MVITAIVTEEEVARIRLTRQKEHVPLPHADATTGSVVPITHDQTSELDLGAEVHGIDLNNFTDADFDFISNSLHKHKLLVFKKQPVR